MRCAVLLDDVPVLRQGVGSPGLVCRPSRQRTWLRQMPQPEIRTGRLLLRRWHRDDAALLKDAIDSSLDHLRAWMPWALAEPSAIEVLQARLDGFSAFLT
jgi:hypothetical protein